MHHAGMLRGDRNLTERLFSDGYIKVRTCMVSEGTCLHIAPANTHLTALRPVQLLLAAD